MVYLCLSLWMVNEGEYTSQSHACHLGTLPETTVRTWKWMVGFDQFPLGFRPHVEVLLLLVSWRVIIWETKHPSHNKPNGPPLAWAWPQQNATSDCDLELPARHLHLHKNVPTWRKTNSPTSPGKSMVERFDPHFRRQIREVAKGLYIAYNLR